MLNTTEKQTIFNVFPNQSYNYDNKETWVRLGRKLARQIVKGLGLKTGEYKISVNRAGIAVGADISIYTPWAYIALHPSCTSRYGVYWRTCEKLGDCGVSMKHHNRWADLRDIVMNTDAFVAEVVAAKVDY